VLSYFGQYHEHAKRLNNEIRQQHHHHHPRQNNGETMLHSSEASATTAEVETKNFESGWNIEEVNARIGALSPSEHRQFIQEAITTQILRYLEYWQQHQLLRPPFPPRPTEQILRSLLEHSTHGQRAQQLDERLAAEFVPGSVIDFPDGFSLQIRKSRIDHPESGYGVFLNGHVLPGTLLAMYPGRVYFPGTLSREVALNNSYMIGRYDAIAVDGRDWGLELVNKVVAAGALNQSVIDDASLNKYRNPLGIGHYFNHPPSGSEANVMSIAYDYRADGPHQIPSQWRSFISNVPNETHSMFYSDSTVLVHGVALIATRHIKNDEEVFLNYRYNPKHSHPQWYHQPDPEEAQRRWAKPRYFWLS
jgi:hypothetical protein